MADASLPTAGTRVKCINNNTRPELEVGKTYVVVHLDFLNKMPMNKERYYPDDFRFIAIQMTDQKGVFPFGIFEVV